MKINELKQIISNGGATLNSTGKQVSYKNGYQVSKKDCYILNVKNLNKVLKAVNRTLVNLAENDFCGLWVDNGLIYIDISEHIARLSNAMQIGIERKQKSIFDWCMSRCICLEV